MIDRLYTIKEVSSMLGISSGSLRKRITYCINCGKSIKNCKCKVFSPKIKGVDISSDISLRSEWRVSESEIKRLLRRPLRRK